MSCYLCKRNSRETYWGYFCPKCKTIQKLMAIYDPDTIHDLCDKALKVQEHAMERKVNQSISKVIKGENPPKYNLRSIDS